jgi:hypothetical protein
LLVHNSSSLLLMSAKYRKYSCNFYSFPCTNAEEVKKNFYRYVSSFRKNDDPIYNRHMEIKLNHSIQVCKEIKSIGQSIGMNNEEMAFLETIAWLHDIGRFEQYNNFRTFADAESENHALIALRVIENQEILREMESQAREVIYRSILNHNIPKVSEDEPDTIQLYSRLLRDADKLDIWRISIEMNIFHHLNAEALPDHYVVPHDLLNCFKENKIILLDQVKSFYDSTLFRLSWIYDLNFTYAVEQVKKREIVKKLIAKLPESPSLKSISGLINQYMNQMILNNNSI